MLCSNSGSPLAHSQSVSQLWRYHREAAVNDTWSPCRHSCPRCTEPAAVQGWCGTSVDSQGQSDHAPISLVLTTSGTSCGHYKTPAPLHQRWSAEYADTMQQMCILRPTEFNNHNKRKKATLNASILYSRVYNGKTSPNPVLLAAGGLGLLSNTMCFGSTKVSTTNRTSICLVISASQTAWLTYNATESLAVIYMM